MSDTTDMTESEMLREFREHLETARKAKADMLRAERKATRAAFGTTIRIVSDQWPKAVRELRYRNGRSVMILNP